MPPGHRLIAAPGADRAPESWFESWGLWGLFGVLVVSVFAGWLGGWPVGAIAFVGLLLTYQEAPEYIWLWANLLAAVALARVAPEGKFLKAARAWRLAAFALLGLRAAAVPVESGAYRAASAARSTRLLRECDTPGHGNGTSEPGPWRHRRRRPWRGPSPPRMP